VVIVKPRTIPKTSSGKIARARTRWSFEGQPQSAEDVLQVLFKWHRGDKVVRAASPRTTPRTTPTLRGSEVAGSSSNGSSSSGGSSSSSATDSRGSDSGHGGSCDGCTSSGGGGDGDGEYGDGDGGEEGQNEPLGDHGEREQERPRNGALLDTPRAQELLKRLKGDIVMLLPEDSGVTHDSIDERRSLLQLGLDSMLLEQFKTTLHEQYVYCSMSVACVCVYVCVRVCACVRACVRSC
jgi:hypothetical protein